MSLTIAVWVIAVSVVLGVVAALVFLLNFQRDITKTLTELEITLKSVNKNINLLSEELHKTLKNTTGITEETKNLIRNINTITSLNAILQPISSFGGQKDFFSKIINIGKIALGVVQGYNLYKKFIGGKNEREQS